MRKHYITTTAAALLILGHATLASAAVSEEDAAQLGKQLTPMGGILAGNEAGTIPPWSGGLKQPPQHVDYQGSGSHHPNPFADDRPLFKISAANLDQYADKLTPGIQALLKQNPDTLWLPIYETRRTHSTPEWVADNTLKNATNAVLVDDGNGVSNAFGGIPFPIPQNGNEAIWNLLLRWQGENRIENIDGFVISRNGDKSQVSNQFTLNFPYYREGQAPEEFSGEYWMIMDRIELPTRQKGEVVISRDPINYTQNQRTSYQYIPGQRRVRRAPTVGFDTPVGGSNGMVTFDDSMMFNGSPELFEWKLVGRQEMYIPYNNYELASPAHPYTDILTDKHVNPEFDRWELHRVWVLEGTLKEGKRHIYGKRTLYLDEDSWVPVLGDNYDGRGQLWRTKIAYNRNAYELPGVVSKENAFYDLISGGFYVGLLQNETQASRFNVELDDSIFTPQYLRKISRR